ncbi:MAG: c-type cytochrome [Candidatus Rokuibacteriota bacterium]
MMRVRTIAGVVTVGAMLALATTWGLGWAQGKWEAPAGEKAKKNPVPKNAESVAAGKKIADVSCAPCHGALGKGDGPAAAALPKKPANWTAKEVQTEADGSLFWKITTGNAPMPPWQSLPEKDRWHLVNYIKSLGGK